MGLYRAGTLGVKVRAVPRFGEFAVGWWYPKTCEYLKSRMARRKLSTTYPLSTDGGKTPVGRAVSYNRFLSALKAIGIDKKEMTRRGLTFHKWRHFFNTTLRMGNVADSKVRELTGHKTAGMTEHYTHFDPREFGDVKKIQESMVPGILNGPEEKGDGTEPSK
jgi:integrase